MVGKKSSHYFSEGEFQILRKLSQKMDPPIPHKIFRLIAQKFVMTPIAAVVLRKRGSKTQVLLIERDRNDPDWGGLLHCPGTILRTNDINTKRDFSPALNRLEENELKTRFSKTPVFITTWFHKVTRGVENAMVYVCQIKGAPKVGKFYDIENLPNNIIKSQIGFIKFAVKEALSRNIID